MTNLKIKNGGGPRAFITHDKKRIKQYENSVYLDSGKTFEIEMYNPTENKVLGVIEINGESIGNGIVLRPGERVFLDRYIDTPNKFVFNTYMVDNDLKSSVVNNGKVKVSFFYETSYGTQWVNTTINHPDVINSPTVFYTYTGGSILSNMSSQTSFETGRVEKGGQSDQVFTYDNSIFSTFSFDFDEWTILPKSRLRLTSKDLKVYCSSCGRRRRKSENYCPSCGKKF